MTCHGVLVHPLEATARQLLFNSLGGVGEAWLVRRVEFKWHLEAAVRVIWVGAIRSAVRGGRWLYCSARRKGSDACRQSRRIAKYCSQLCRGP